MGLNLQRNVNVLTEPTGGMASLLVLSMLLKFLTLNSKLVHPPRCILIGSTDE